MTIARRNLLQSAVASVALAAPAMLPGCLISPAAASILKSAPYVPAPDDTKLFRLSERFHAAAAEQEASWCRLLAISSPTREDLAAHEIENEELYAEWVGTSDACYEIAPTTPAGAAALLKVILKRDDDFIDDEPKKALHALSEALAAMVRA